jgi:L-fucose mutarotase
MLRGKLIHPEILEALGKSGHGSKILIADGNYPFTTGSNPAAKKVFLNLAPGQLSATTVLAALAQAIPVEAAQVMGKDGDEPSIFKDFREILPGDVTLQPLERFTFYATSRETDVALVIATGEERTYANILITIGVVQPQS